MTTVLLDTDVVSFLFKGDSRGAAYAPFLQGNRHTPLPLFRQSPETLTHTPKTPGYDWSCYTDLERSIEREWAGMIERLQRTFEELEQLPREAQEEVAAQIETLLAEMKSTGHPEPHQPGALDRIGAWSDIPWEQMEEDLDTIRHESQPTPPIDEL
jgi:hypothetical protein